GLKYSDDFLTWTGTVIALVISFYLIIKACAILTSGTVYAVFTGMGAAAIALIDFLGLGADITIGKGICISVIIFGGVGNHKSKGEKEIEGARYMTWFYLFIASFGEMFSVKSINLFFNSKKWRWLFSVIVVFSFCFYFLARAMREIPLGTAYAVWTGIGATGTVLAGIIFFGEKASLGRMIFLTCIIIVAAGLK